ncbi:Exonuclease SbcC [Streptomyces misionensis JCM 4497]
MINGGRGRREARALVRGAQHVPVPRRRRVTPVPRPSRSVTAAAWAGATKGPKVRPWGRGFGEAEAGEPALFRFAGESDRGDGLAGEEDRDGDARVPLCTGPGSRPTPLFYGGVHARTGECAPCVRTRTIRPGGSAGARCS